MREQTYRNLMNEGHDGYNPYDKPVAWTPEWTKEETIARRAAWNAQMVKAKKAGRKVNLAIEEKRAGFRLETLKLYIAHYEL